MKTIFLLVLLVLLGGCAGRYVPPCEVKDGWFSDPCVGWSNGTTLSPVEADMKLLGKRYYPAIIHIDEKGDAQFVRLR